MLGESQAHALPVPVHREADLIPTQVDVLGFHDTGARVHTRIKFLLW